MKLSDTALIVLNGAAGRDDRLVPRRTSVPPVADVNACRALVKPGLVEVVRAPAGAREIVTVREDDSPMAFVITDAGFRALNLDPPGSAETAATAPHTAEDDEAAHDAVPAGEAATEAPTAPHTGTEAAEGPNVAAVPDATDAAPVAPADASPARTTLRQAAAAVLAAWGDEANRETDIIAALEPPMATLRSLLAGRTPRAVSNAPRKPREGTKQQAVLTMLCRAEGATVAQVMEATGWASHTVRGFFAGLKKKGIPVEVKERVKQVGPDKQGAKGSYTIYHVTTAA
jgi:hypothetical protein